MIKKVGQILMDIGLMLRLLVGFFILIVLSLYATYMVQVEKKLKGVMIQQNESLKRLEVVKESLYRIEMSLTPTPTPIKSLKK